MQEKDGHKHDWKDCPDNKYGNKYQGYENHAIYERERDYSQEREITFENRYESNIMQYESEDEFEDGMPILEARYDSDFESEDEVSVDWDTYYRKKNSSK